MIFGVRRDAVARVWMAIAWGAQKRACYTARTRFLWWGMQSRALGLPFQGAWGEYQRYLDTSRRFALGAKNVCLVDENPTCLMSAL